MYLQCYSFSINSIEDNVTVEPSVFNDRDDVLDIMTTWINKMKNSVYLRHDKLRSIHIEDDSKIERNGRYLIGQICTGRTGTGSTIKTSDLEFKARKNHNDLDILNLLYLMWVPKKGKNGIMLFQEHDRLSAGSTIKEYFLDMFDANYGSDFVLSIRPVVFKQIIDEYLKQADLVELELKRRVTSADENEAVNPDKNKFKNPFLTVKYSPDHTAKCLKKGLIDLIRGKYDKNEKVFLGFEFDDAKMTLSLGEKKRQIKLSNLYSNVNRWPLKEKISLDLDRIPIYNDVKEEAMEVVKYFHPNA